MSVIAWLVVGVLAGWIGSLLVNRRGEGSTMDIVLGVAGAFAGGFLFHLSGYAGGGVSLYSVLVAVVGSVVVLIVYHTIQGPKML